MGTIKYLILLEIYYFQKYVRQAKRCFLLDTRLRGGDRYLVLQKSQSVGRILESDTCSQNKPHTSLWPQVKRRIQESDLH